MISLKKVKFFFCFFIEVGGGREGGGSLTRVFFSIVKETLSRKRQLPKIERVNKGVEVKVRIM